MSIDAATEADHVLISQHVAGREVLQLGHLEGYDTAMIARHARRVVAVGMRSGLPHGAFPNAVAQWFGIQRFYHTDANTLFHAGEIVSALFAFVPGQFDVAVVNYAVFSDPISWGLTLAATRLARKVIVLPVPGIDLTSEIAPAITGGRIAMPDGNLWVVSVPEQDRNDEGKDES